MSLVTGGMYMHAIQVTAKSMKNTHLHRNTLLILALKMQGKFPSILVKLFQKSAHSEEQQFYNMQAELLSMGPSSIPCTVIA